MNEKKINEKKQKTKNSVSRSVDCGPAIDAESSGIEVIPRWPESQRRREKKIGSLNPISVISAQFSNGTQIPVSH